MPPNAAMATRGTTSTTERSQPWYREPWPWIVMAGRSLVVVAATATFGIAVATDDGVVAEDYYKRGLVINQMLEKENRAAALQIGAVVTLADDGAVRVELSGLGDRLAGEKIRFRLTHATRAGMDRAATLQRGDDEIYRGRIDPVVPGRWLVVVESDDWRLPTVEVGGRPEAVRLGVAR